MKASRLFLYLVFGYSWLTFLGCDTASSIESPSKNYFLKYFGNDGDQTGVDLVVNPDGTIVIFGTSKVKTPNSQTDDTQFYVVKADPTGNLIWEKTFGGPNDEEARDIELTSDGRIIIVGNSYSSVGGPRDLKLIILDQNGGKLDSLVQPYISENGLQGDVDAASVSETQDGFIVAGSTSNLHDLSHPTFKKEALMARYLDKPLKVYPSPWPDKPSTGQTDESSSTKIVQLPDQSFYLFGHSKYSQLSGSKPDFDLWYVNITQDGGIGSVWTFGATGTSDEKLSAVGVVPNQGGYFLSGTSTNQATDVFPYIAKLRGYPLGFSDNTDFEPPLPTILNSVKLGATANSHTGAAITAGTGYLTLYTEAQSPGNGDILLTKIGLDGLQAWQTIYGGAGDDVAGSVQELADGKILVVGTMSIGQVPGETKMVLIKVNKSGQFAE